MADLKDIHSIIIEDVRKSSSFSEFLLHIPSPKGLQGHWDL